MDKPDLMDTRVTNFMGELDVVMQAATSATHLGAVEEHRRLQLTIWQWAAQTENMESRHRMVLLARWVDDNPPKKPSTPKPIKASAGTPEAKGGNTMAARKKAAVAPAAPAKKTAKKKAAKKTAKK